MCRPNTLGGRRCPSHSNPVAVANRNARRRAQYAKSHGKTLQPETSHIGTVVNHSVPISSFGNIYKETNFHDKSGEQLLRKASDEHKPYQKLNITSETYTGELVDLKYINEKQISGVINYTQLDEDSYKEFGFAPIETEGDNINLHGTMRSEYEVAELSEPEIAVMSDDEKTALRMFTSNHYKTINRALYNTNEEYTPLSAEPDDKSLHFQFGKEFNLYETYYDEARFSPSFMTELTENLDSAFTKSPGYQRTVYRGMSGYNAAFRSPDYDSADGTEATHWIKKNVKLGQEMVFDGYQSSSVDQSIALDYASGDGGVVYEVITSTGINVTKISAYKNEMEVILPRSARYMVVGVHQGVNIGHRKNMNVVQMVEINDQGAVAEAGNHTPPPALTHTQLGAREPFRLKTEAELKAESAALKEPSTSGNTSINDWSETLKNNIAQNIAKDSIFGGAAVNADPHEGLADWEKELLTATETPAETNPAKTAQEVKDESEYNWF
jgi:hypothetical protein